MEENQVQENPQETGGKTEKKFNESLSKVVSIIGGKQNLRPKKRVKGDVVSSIVEELTKEDTEKARENVKTELKTLLTKYIEFEDEVEKKEKELSQLKEKKQKEFIEASGKFFSRIEDVDSFTKRMEETLSKATNS